MAHLDLLRCAALLAALAIGAGDRAAVAQPVAGGAGGFPLAGADAFRPGINFGPAISGSNNALSFRGSGVGSGGTFTDSSLNVVPTLRLFGDYAPGNWNGGFIGGFVGLGVPTGGSSGSFTTSNGIAVGARVSPTGPWLDFGARLGTFLPGNTLLPNGQIFVQAGGSFQQFDTRLSAPSVGDNFVANQAFVRPLVGVGATLPITTDWGPIDLGFTFNLYPGVGDTQLPGGGLLSFGTFQPNTTVSGLITIGIPLGLAPFAPPTPPPPPGNPPPPQTTSGNPPPPPGNPPPPQTTSGNPPPPPPGNPPPPGTTSSTPPPPLPQTTSRPPPPPPPTSSGDSIAAVTPGTTAVAHEYCPYPSGKVSVDMVDAETGSGVVGGLTFGTTDTYTSLADIVGQLKAKVAPHYDPTGKCGKCIQKLSIWGHGGGGSGYITFGPDDTQIGGVTSDVTAKFEEIGALMCIGGEVVVNECNAGQGNTGSKALQTLADKIGVPVSGPTSKIKACRVFGGTFTSYKEASPGSGAKTPAQNKAGPVSAP